LQYGDARRNIGHLSPNRENQLANIRRPTQSALKTATKQAVNKIYSKEIEDMTPLLIKLDGHGDGAVG
jgi:hypothetical protein